MSSILSVPLTPNPQTQLPGQPPPAVDPNVGLTGGGNTIGGLQDPSFSIPQFGTPQQFALPENLGIQPGAPLGAYTDSQYLSDEAALRYQIASQYQDVLKQLGHTDAQGNVIPGAIVQQANIKAADLEHQRQMAIQEVTRRMQQEGTIFSGIRGTEQGQAEDPIVRAQNQLTLDTPAALGDQFNTAQGLISQYNLENNRLLAAAAARAAAAINQSPAGAAAAPAPGGTTTGAGGATDGTTPPPTVTPPTDLGTDALYTGSAPPRVNLQGVDLIKAPVSQGALNPPTSPTPTVSSSDIYAATQRQLGQAVAA